MVESKLKSEISVFVLRFIVKQEGEAVVYQKKSMMLKLIKVENRFHLICVGHAL